MLVQTLRQCVALGGEIHIGRWGILERSEVVTGGQAEERLLPRSGWSAKLRQRTLGVPQ